MHMSISLYSKRCMSWSVTPTCLNGDCCRVSYEAGVDSIDSEGIVCFGTQLRYQSCAHICLQINLLHTQKAAEPERACEQERLKLRERWKIKKVLKSEQMREMHRQCNDTQILVKKTIFAFMSLLKYYVTEVTWSGGVFSAAHSSEWS